MLEEYSYNLLTDDVIQDTVADSSPDTPEMSFEPFDETTETSIVESMLLPEFLAGETVYIGYRGSDQRIPVKYFKETVCTEKESNGEYTMVEEVYHRVLYVPVLKGIGGENGIKHSITSLQDDKNKYKGAYKISELANVMPFATNSSDSNYMLDTIETTDLSKDHTTGYRFTLYYDQATIESIYKFLMPVSLRPNDYIDKSRLSGWLGNNDFKDIMLIDINNKIYEYSKKEEVFSKPLTHKLKNDQIQYLYMNDGNEDNKSETKLQVLWDENDLRNTSYLLSANLKSPILPGKEDTLQNLVEQSKMIGAPYAFLSRARETDTEQASDKYKYYDVFSHDVISEFTLKTNYAPSLWNMVMFLAASVLGNDSWTSFMNDNYGNMRTHDTKTSRDYYKIFSKANATAWYTRKNVTTTVDGVDFRFIDNPGLSIMSKLAKMSEMFVTKSGISNIQNDIASKLDELRKKIENVQTIAVVSGDGSQTMYARTMSNRVPDTTVFSYNNANIDNIENFLLNPLNQYPILSESKTVVSGFGNDAVLWSLVPSGIDETEGQFEWSVSRTFSYDPKTQTKRWSEWSAPSLYAKYTEATGQFVVDIYTSVDKFIAGSNQHPQRPDNGEPECSWNTELHTFVNSPKANDTDREFINNGYMSNWSITPSTLPNRILYKATAYFDGLGNAIKADGTNVWSLPVRLTGEDGENGTDGTQLEFIYLRTGRDNLNNMLTSPVIYNSDNFLMVPGSITDSDTCINKITASQQNDYLPVVETNGSRYVWKDNAQGVKNETGLEIEWMAQRRKITVGSNTYWSKFTRPVVWSAYGETGLDGDGIEYIFKRTNRDTTTFATDDNPNRWPISNSKYYYGPTGHEWSDNPVQLTDEEPVQWMSCRKQVGGQWQRFSEPAIWSTIGKKGDRGTDALNTEYIYKLTQTDTPPEIDSNEFYTANETQDAVSNYQDREHIPAGWTDDPTGIDMTNRYEWVAVRHQFSDSTKFGKWSKFTYPSVWSAYGKKGTDSDSVEYIYTAVNHSVNLQSTNVDNRYKVQNLPANQTEDYVPELWHDDPVSLTEEKDTLWMSCRYYKASGTNKYGDTVKSWGKFTVPKLWSSLAENPLVIDLDNEVDSFACYSDGTKKWGLPVSTKISLYYGPEKITSKTLTITNKPDGVTASISNEVLSVTDVEPGVAKKFNVTVTATADVRGKEYSRSATFSVNKVFGAVIYNLVPSVNYISKDKRNNLSVSTVSVSIRATEESSSNILTALPAGYSVYVSLDNKQATNKGLTAVNTNTFNNSCKFELRNGNDVVDSETIYIISGGADGNPGKDAFNREYIYFNSTSTFNITDATNETYFGTGKGPDNTSTVKFQNTDFLPLVRDYQWTDNPTGVTPQKQYEWVSYRDQMDVQNADGSYSVKWSKFTTPVLWSAYGNKGQDGDGVEYVYILTTTETDTAPDISKISADNNEYQTSSEYVNTINTLENGKYKFTKTVNGATKTTSWTDDPSGVSQEFKAEWVSVRKYLSGTEKWGKFSKPALWARYGDEWQADLQNNYWLHNGEKTSLKPYVDEETLDLGSGLEFTAGARTLKVKIDNSTLKFKTDGTLYAVADTGAIEDQINAASSTTKFLFTKTVLLSNSGTSPAAPTKPSDLTYNKETNEISGEFNVNDYVWHTTDDNLTALGINELLWMLIVIFDADGNQYDTEGPVIISGNPQQTVGSDTDEIKYIYHVSKNGDGLPTPANNETIEDITSHTTLVTNMWTEHPQGVSETYPFEYCSYKTRKFGDAFTDAWSSYCKPFIWSKWGVDGRDGDGLEYIYKRFTSKQSNLANPTPSNYEDNSTYQEREYLPTGWTDSPKGVTVTDKFEYVCIRKYNSATGKWERFSDPAVFSMYTTPEPFEFVEYHLFLADNEHNKENTVKADIETIKSRLTDSNQYTIDSILNFNNINSGWSKSYQDANGQWQLGPFVFKTQGSITSCVSRDSLAYKYISKEVEVEVVNGTSPYSADLDNEMDCVITDVNGKCVPRTIITNISLYQGETKINGVTNSADIIRTNTVSSNNTPDWSTTNNNTRVEIKFTESNTLTGPVEYSIPIFKAGELGTIIKTVKLTITPVKPGNNAVIYQLKPSATAIVYNGSSYSPTSVNCNVIKIDGPNTELLSTLPTNYTIETYTVTGNTESKSQSITVNSFNNVDSVKYTLKNGTTVIDTETVPIVRKGNTGPQGPGGSNGSTGATELTYYIRSKDNTKIKTATLTSGVNLDNSTMLGKSSVSNMGSYVGTDNISNSPFKIDGSDGYICQFIIHCLSTDGGSTLKTYSSGKYWTTAGFFSGKNDGAGTDTTAIVYCAGDYDPAKTYKVTTTNGYNSVPYVSYNNKLWLYDTAGAGVTGTAPASTTGNPWKEMPQQDISYSKISIAKKGQINSMCFYDDWMFSSNGTVNGSISTDFSKFSPKSTLTNSVMTSINTGSAYYIPNYAINTQNGSAIFGNGNMQINADGSGIFNNTVTLAKNTALFKNDGDIIFGDNKFVFESTGKIILNNNTVFNPDGTVTLGNGLLTIENDGTLEFTNADSNNLSKIRFGFIDQEDSNNGLGEVGEAALWFFDSNGIKQYNLGPSGLKALQQNNEYILPKATLLYSDYYLISETTATSVINSEINNQVINVINSITSDFTKVYTSKINYSESQVFNFSGGDKTYYPNIYKYTPKMKKNSDGTFSIANTGEYECFISDASNIETLSFNDIKKRIIPVGIYSNYSNLHASRTTNYVTIQNGTTVTFDTWHSTSYNGATPFGGLLLRGIINISNSFILVQNISNVGWKITNVSNHNKYYYNYSTYYHRCLNNNYGSFDMNNWYTISTNNGVATINI